LPFIEYNVGSKVQYFLHCSRRKVENQSHPARDSFKIQDMGYRSRQCDMSHTLTASCRFRNINTAAVTDHTFITDFLIFTTVTFPVLAWSENTFADEPVAFRL